LSFLSVHQQLILPNNNNYLPDSHYSSSLLNRLLLQPNSSFLGNNCSVVYKIFSTQRTRHGQVVEFSQHGRHPPTLPTKPSPPSKFHRFVTDSPPTERTVSHLLLLLFVRADERYSTTKNIHRQQLMYGSQQSGGRPITQKQVERNRRWRRKEKPKRRKRRRRRTAAAEGRRPIDKLSFAFYLDASP
jgi:hypothetical protein